MGRLSKNVWPWRAFVEAGCVAVQEAGRPAFPEAIDNWINAMLPIDSIAVFTFDVAFRARHLFTVGRLGPGVGEHLARDYTERFAAADPAWRGRRARAAAGDRLFRLSPDEGYNETYLDHFFVRHALVDKAAIIQPVGAQYLYCNFYRMARTGRFSRRDWRILPLVLPQVASTIALHAMRCSSRTNQPPASRVDAPYVVQGFSDSSSGPFGNLAAREREVCYRTLLGLTAEAIARDLGISTSTVVTYRRRAYGKLGITTQRELFGLFLQRGSIESTAMPAGRRRPAGLESERGQTRRATSSNGSRTPRGPGMAPSQ